MKITCFELEESFIDLDDVLLNEVDIMSETENANNALIELDSLQGEAAVTLKDYFSTIHSPIISGIMCACTNLYMNLRAFFEDYHSTVDSKRSSVLCDEYISEKKENIGVIQSNLDDVVDNIHNILASVADIFTTTATHTTYEEQISTNVGTAQEDMQKVIADLEAFNAAHVSDCDIIMETLDDILSIIKQAKNVFVDNQISSVTDESLLSALSSLDSNITDMTVRISADPHAVASVFDCLDKTMTIYGVGEMLAVLGISASDYSKLLKKGLKIRSFKGSNGEIMFKIVGDGMSRDSIKSILNGMNISHMTPAKINKLTGKGLVVLDQASNIRSAGLMNTLTEVDGFKSASRIMTTGDMPPLVKWKGYSKLVDGIGWGIDGGVNFFDNCYDENGRGWTFTGETIGDTLTDTAVDIGLDIGIEATCAFLGSFIPIPIVGTVVGYVAGVAISTAVSSVPWPKTEPPKTISDMTKDVVSDISHSITDSLSRLFW